jgi:hypothetical protein
LHLFRGGAVLPTPDKILANELGRTLLLLLLPLNMMEKIIAK